MGASHSHQWVEYTQFCQGGHSAAVFESGNALLPYLGPEGVGGYRKKCDEIAAKGYEGFALA